MRTCRFCGKAFEPRRPSQIYCTPKCKKDAWNRKQAIEYRNTLGVKAPDPAVDCPDDCIYLNTNGIRTCDYIVKEHERRGCAGGRNCARYTHER